MNHVLLVEDDEVFRKVARKALEILGYTVREAENGLVAKTIFDLNRSEFKLVISDVRMPEVDGVTLLKYIRQYDTDIKFILMTGFSDVIEANEASAAGANEFLPKPFRLENLKLLIDNCFNPQPVTQEEETVREKYCRIPVEEFVTSSRLLVDLHVRVTGEKYIKIAHAGDEVSVDRLKRYREKKVDYFYVRPEDLRKLVGLNLKLNKVLDAKGKSVRNETKLKLLTNTANLITQSYYFDGLNRETLADASQILENTINMVADEPTFLSLLGVLQKEGDQLYSHCVAVSIYSVVIAKQMGIKSPTTYTRIALGGLLHDIGKKEFPPELINKPRWEMNAGEIKTYESHCQRGKEILSQIPGIPEDVVQIAAHHHENNVATGFPYSLEGSRIHPLAKIVAVADCFINALFRLKADDKISVIEAVNKLMTLHEMEYDQQIVKALAHAFGVSTEGRRRSI